MSQIPAGTDPIKLASRQADLLAQQGRMDEAKRVLAQIKPANAEQARRKVLAQSFLLREYRETPAAYALVKAELAQKPDDSDLLTELALLCEKLKRYDEMETLLRQLMVQSPQEAHAFNALGYSLADRNIRLDEARQLIEKAVQTRPARRLYPRQSGLGFVQARPLCRCPADFASGLQSQARCRNCRPFGRSPVGHGANTRSRQHLA